MVRRAGYQKTMLKLNRFYFVRLSIFIASTLVSVLFLLPVSALAHPGRTDASGCHTCRTNCSKWGLSSGEYHCHRSKGIPQPSEPIKSHRGENGIGYTTPAPEYKQPEKVKEKNNKLKTEAKNGESWFSKLLKIFNK